MSNINVLIVVDALGAATTGNLQNNVYLVDTNKHVGSYNEGNAELYTACNDGDVISWAVTPINPNDDVSIFSFTGQMIDNGICNPAQQGIANDYYWEGRVEARGQTGNIQYSVVLKIDDRPYSFDPFLVIS